MSTATRGVRSKSKPSKKELRHKDVQALISQLNKIQQNLSRLALQTARDIAILKEQNANNHEVIGGVVEYLQTVHALTDDQLLEYINSAIKRWHDEKLQDIKDKVPAGVAVCETCLHAEQLPAFEFDSENVAKQELACAVCWSAFMQKEVSSEDPQCSRCKSPLIPAGELAAQNPGNKCPKCFSDTVFVKEAENDLQSE